MANAQGDPKPPAAINTRDGSTFGPGQKTFLGPWGLVNLTTSLSASALLVGGVADASTFITMPYPGSILAIAGSLGSNLTAGTLTLAATVNGATVFSVANTATTVKTFYSSQVANTDFFVAGDRVGVKATTTADFAPTSADLAVVLVVEI